MNWRGRLTLLSMASLLLPITLPANSWAHGNLFDQASGATTSCLEFMAKTEPKKLVRLFKSVSTAVVGNEIFEIAIHLKDEQTFSYKAVGVDGSDGSFSWSCEKVLN